jgi:hypothetical protein
LAWEIATPLVKETCTSPAINAASAGAPPLYGTWTISIPAMLLNNSPERWFALPMPDEAYEMRGLRVRAYVISSLTDFTGTALLTER